MYIAAVFNKGEELFIRFTVRVFMNVCRFVCVFFLLTLKVGRGI